MTVVYRLFGLFFGQHFMPFLVQEALADPMPQIRILMNEYRNVF